ncbi:MAG: response regulator [Desulfobacteraceae bacterium]|nr:response regulator [Desulfobacteraceae bacterium]
MYTVLLADDEKVIRDGCSRLLRSEGYNVLTAVDGREALSLIESEPVDVVLCDLVMPVMGAFEVLDGIKASSPELPLIVITGHGTVSTAVEAMKKGAYDFITKPFRSDHLTLIVQRALEKQVLERRARELQEEQARNLYDLTMEKSRIRTIVNCMADGVLVTNRELEVVLHNPAVMSLMGISIPLSEPSSLRDYIDDESLAGDLRSILSASEGVAGVLSRDLRKGDKFLHAVCAPVLWLDGQVLGTVTVFQDITFLKQLDQLKSDFVQMVSHELRSPLAAIKQLLSVVLDGLAGELAARQRDLLERARVKIQSQLELINDLLDIAKIESRQSFQQQIPLDLAEVLRRTIELMQPRAQSQNVSLMLQAPDKLPLVQADLRCMEELFSNLVSNAINYSPDGGDVVVLASTSGEMVDIFVSDTGIGMDAAEVPKIFDKFYRIKHPKTRQVVGTGLGLSIVKGIIDSHRGSIEVDSRPGLGTTFRVLLPVLQPASM